MSTFRQLAPALALSLAALLPACASPRMSIRSMEPGRVSVGAATQLVILDGVGRRSAREIVNQELINQARWHGYFSVLDRSEDGLSVRLAGRRAIVEGAENPLEEVIGEEQLGVRVDVIEWQAFRDSHQVRSKGEDGTVYVEDVPVYRGVVLLAVTLFDSEGRAMLAETEYEGDYATYDLDMPRADLMDQAARQAVQYFLGDVTPREVVSSVRLDDEDPEQETILKTARAGNVRQAATDMRSYLGRHSHSASAAYNLAVFLEAIGDFQQALDMYDRALSNGAKGYYSDARAQCARRLAAVEALEGYGQG